MEELLKIAYENFLDTNDVNNSKSVRIINSACYKMYDSVDSLKDVLSEKLYNDISDKIRDGVCDIQEAAFIAGFACCAKFVTKRIIYLSGGDSNRRIYFCPSATMFSFVKIKDRAA